MPEIFIYSSPLVPQTCVSELAITWINAGLLLIWPFEQTSVKLESKYKNFHLWKCIWKSRLRSYDHLCRGVGYEFTQFISD